MVRRNPTKNGKLVPESTPQRRSPRLMSFRFFDLPRELRDMVFDEFWKCTPPMRVYLKGLEFHVRHRDAQDDDSGSSDRHKPISILPPGLRANKQFLAEGLDRIQRKGLWSWVSYQPRFEDVAPLLPLTSARSLEIRVSKSRRDRMGPNGIRANDLCRRLGTMSEKRPGRSSLRVLHISFVEYPWRFAWLSLPRLGTRLDKLEVDAGASSARSYAEFVSSMSKIGNLMVPKKNRHTFEEARGRWRYTVERVRS
ncbi:hypothetical protein K505DRAFT_362888 [Melanomma pulvis-pyrius CBS 109.77]|uniref:Uncharacterized protein n=1 Tax=Melanomma pulvis-pyrius CBS 109.77 TaxID=1314802 RepID=A0A6A6X7V2_9PLEO|nr:hypothetical protein K505DRAFT_362888 [Melanomma pulvis-pyrius CBS 109.77]